MPYSAGIKEAARRQAARSVEEGGTARGSTPDHRCASYEEAQKIRDFVRLVYGGTRTMRTSEDILPKHPGEDPAVDASEEGYKRRVLRTTAFNAFQRTVEGLVGMVFRKDPTLTDVPTQILADTEDIDQQGNDLAVFAKGIAVDAMIDGHVFVHVEAPDRKVLDEKGVKNRRDVRTAGIRPYWLPITADRVINWRYHMEGGKPVTDLLVYTEAVDVPVGDFGQERIERFRVLRPGAYEVWVKGQKSWLIDEEGTTGISYVPVVPIYAKKTGQFQSMPPLLDLAYEQVDHFQVRSDYRTSMTFSAISVLAILGAKADNIKWGANFLLRLEEQGADAKLIESSGNGLGAMRQELKDVEERMAALGLEMLVRDKTGNRTAREVSVKSAESTSALATFAAALEDGLTQCLAIHGDYRNVSEAGTVEVNRDFEAQALDPQTFQQLREAAATNQISLRTLWERMVAGGILPDGFDADAEIERLAQQSAELLDVESTVLEEMAA